MFGQIIDSLKKSKYNPDLDIETASFINILPKDSCKVIFNDKSVEDVLHNSIEFHTKYVIIKSYKIKRNKGIFLVQDRNENQKYICRIRKNSSESDDEIKIFIKLINNTSDKIANYISYTVLEDYTYFIIEYINGITLYDYIKNKEIDNTLVCFILKEILTGLLFIHSHSIIHCDIKLDNIMISDDNKIKIIDFDLSKIMDNGVYMSDNIFGTLKYISPESYDLGIYTYKSDIWSLGILLYVIITNKFPYNMSLHITDSYSNLYRRNEFKHPDMNLLKKMIKKNKYDNKLYDILSCMIEFNVDKRYDVIQLITKINFDELK